MNEENLEIEGLNFLIYEDKDFDLAKEIINQSKLSFNDINFDANKLMEPAEEVPGAWRGRIQLKEYSNIKIRIACGYSDTASTQKCTGSPKYDLFTVNFDSNPPLIQWNLDNVWGTGAFPKPKWFTDDMRFNHSNIWHDDEHYRNTFMKLTQEQVFKLIFES